MPIGKLRTNPMFMCHLSYILQLPVIHILSGRLINENLMMVRFVSLESERESIYDHLISCVANIIEVNRLALKNSLSGNFYRAAAMNRMDLLLRFMMKHIPVPTVQDETFVNVIFIDVGSFLTKDRLRMIPYSLVPVVIVRELLKQHHVHIHLRRRPWKRFVQVYGDMLLAV